MLFALHPLPKGIGAGTDIRCHLRGFGVLVLVIVAKGQVAMALLAVLHDSVAILTKCFDQHGQVHQLRMEAIHLQHPVPMRIDLFATELAQFGDSHPQVQFLERQVHQGKGLNDPHLVVGGGSHATQAPT